jgi:GNAT superfamily N-acetyltransferase
VWASRADLDADTRAELERLCAAEPVLGEPHPDCLPACSERVRELLSPFEDEHRGPAFLLPEALPHDPRAREIAPDEARRWAEAFPWLAAEYDAIVPVAIAFEAGEAAALCHSARGWTAAAAEAGVSTREPFRGRGLARAAVACWARAVQRTGRVALYSTSWDNAASCAVARALSGRLYAENWSVV